MQEQRGARWLAQERREIGAADGSEAPARSGTHQAMSEPPRYPLVERLSARSLAALAEVMGELGMVGAGRG